MDNACYFITSCTADRAKLLNTDTKRIVVKEVLKKAIQQFGVRLYAWVILCDHYHLLLKTSEAAPIHRFIKKLHGESAIRLNQSDGVTGRKVWYQYWDRFPRDERDFWAYFNYIHLNPIKHGYVDVSEGALVADGKIITITSSQTGDLGQSLAQYEYSSYHYYLREYGEGFVADSWLRYPTPKLLGHDEF